MLALAVACCASACPQERRAECLIKGNISSRGERMYHVPGQRYYDKTQINWSKGERWFCTEQEAVDAGWRVSRAERSA
jgi:micrococcal nuclease